MPGAGPRRFLEYGVRQSIWQRLLPGVLLVFAAGCGGDGRPDLVQATGTVKLNGEPLADANIVLMPDEGNPIMRPSRGRTDAQGNFTLWTYQKGDGVPAGSYRVGIQKRQLQGELPENYDPETPEATSLTYEWITPRDLADPAKSGLTAQVTDAGIEPPVFEIERAGPPEIERTGPAARANEP